MFSVTKAAPARDALPGIADGFDTATGNPFYDYDNAAELLRNLAEPTQQDLDRVGSDTSKYQSGTQDHAYAARASYLERKAAEGKDPLRWDAWRNQYIPNQGNANRGNAYEGFGARQIGLSGPDWICQGQIPNAGENRVYDAVNEKQRVAYEFKSGRGIDAAQLAKDQRIAARTGFRIVYIFGQEPTRSAVAKINAAADVTYHKMKATPRLTTVAPPAQGAQSGILSPRSQAPAQGPLTDAIGRSGRNPAEAREIRAVDEEEAQRTGRPNGRVSRPGGIDFTTMELRYVQDTGDGSALEYAFRATELDEDAEPSFGGLEAAQLSSDAFFTWLALPADSFWVNLNPAEPNRIIDPKLGSTDAGRVLLEADLLMKKVAANLTRPSTTVGKQFWDSLRQGPALPNIPCVTVRNWIVPGPATVREEGGRLYIVDAPLRVMSEPLGPAVPPGSGLDVCAADPPEIVAYNQQVYQTVILPRVNDAVNHAPEFEDLRRVYLGRVAAEWIRQRSVGRTTAFSEIVGSGDVTRWPARVPWSAEEVFARFMESWTKGEYQEEHVFTQSGQPVRVIVGYGGVDFSNSPRDNLTPEAFQQAAPAMPETVAIAQISDVTDVDAEHSWLGAQAAPPAPPGQPQPGGGALASTGTSVTATIGVGILLIALGVALVVWQRHMRRRRRIPTM